MQEKVVIIQADNAVLKGFEAFLSGEYKLICKKDGLEAIEWLEKGNHTDLIIAGVSMPYLSSIDFIKELRSHTLLKCIPLLMLSDLERVTERSYYIQAGANDFAVKPLSKTQLKVRIRALLANAKAKPQALAA